MTSLTFAQLIARGSLIVNDGYRTKQSELASVGIPILRVAEIGDGFLEPRSPDRISEEYRSAIGPKLSQAGDVLLTTKGTVGRRAIVPASGAGFAYSPQVCFFRVTDDSIDGRWLYYWLGGANFWNQAAEVATQTDMAPYLSLRDLRAISVNVPSLAEQHAIAASLGVLDDKLESNRRAMQILRDLMNAEFEQATNIREVRHDPLGAITSVTNGRSYRSVELTDSATALVTLKSINRFGNYNPLGLKPYIGVYKPEQIVAPGEIVVAQTDLTQGAEVVGRGVRVPESSRYTRLVASLDLAIVRSAGDMPPEYLMGLLSSESFRQHCRSRVTGTTVLHLAKDAIRTWQAPIIPPTAQHQLAKVLRALLNRADAFALENERLVALRDVLLPELLSRDVRVAAGEVVL